MARRQDRDGGHPVFWLLLGFLCGVMAMLGGLLLLSGELAGDIAPAEPSVAPAPIEPPALKGASPPGGPVALVAPPSIEPLVPIQEPVVRPTLPNFSPDAPLKPVTSPPSSPPVGRSAADQMAEDAAASGMTARTR